MALQVCPERFFMKIFTRGKKKGMEIKMLAWWILALVLLGIMTGAYFILKSKGIDAIEYVKNIFRFRGGGFGGGGASR